LGLSVDGLLSCNHGEQLTDFIADSFKGHVFLVEFLLGILSNLGKSLLFEGIKLGLIFFVK
jgi:hypothetical protein